jgi:hypothetical protein
MTPDTRGPPKRHQLETERPPIVTDLLGELLLMGTGGAHFKICACVIINTEIPDSAVNCRQTGLPARSLLFRPARFARRRCSGGSSAGGAPYLTTLMYSSKVNGGGTAFFTGGMLMRYA